MTYLDELIRHTSDFRQRGDVAESLTVSTVDWDGIREAAAYTPPERGERMRRLTDLPPVPVVEQFMGIPVQVSDHIPKGCGIIDDAVSSLLPRARGGRRRVDAHGEAAYGSVEV